MSNKVFRALFVAYFCGLIGWLSIPLWRLADADPMYWFAFSWFLMMVGAVIGWFWRFPR